MRPDDIDANASRCLCPGCPTYNDCMKEKDQHLYCSRGQTECGPKSNGCICGECPVWDQYQLGSYYYCKEGAAD